MEKKRSTEQNRSMHLYFEKVSKVMMSKGIPLNKLIEKRVEIYPTKEAIKELWKSLQLEMFDKDSTTQLSSDEVTKVYEVLSPLITKYTGEDIPFPARENTKEYLDELEKKYLTKTLR